MMSKKVNGPWKNGPYNPRYVFDNNGVHVCTADYIEHAHLIAAAPDLLEACQIALSALDDPDPQAYKHAMNKCEAAIAKVTGNG